MSRFFSTAFTSLLILLPYPERVEAQVEPISLLLSQAEAAADRLIGEGFDRLDRSMVGAGYEIGNAVTQIQNAIAEETLNLSDIADSQRNSLASELRALIRAAEGSSATITSDVQTATGVVLDSVTVLLSNGVGSVRILPPIALYGAETIRIDLVGAALSQLKVKDLLLDGVSAPFEIPRQDDGGAALIVAMPEFSPDIDTTRPIEVSIAFVVEKPRSPIVRLFRDPFQRRFSTIAVIMPEHIGSITAVYAGAEEVVSEEPKTETRETPRIQTSTQMMGGFLPVPEFERGTWSGPFSIEASGDTTIVRDSVDIRISGGGNCHGSSTAASLGAINDRSFIINARIATTRRAGATCQATVTATYLERTIKTQQVERRDVREEVLFGDRTVFRDADVTDGLTGARIAYFEIASPLFESGIKRVLPDETVPWAKVETDPAAGYSYVSVTMQ